MNLYLPLEQRAGALVVMAKKRKLQEKEAEERKKAKKTRKLNLDPAMTAICDDAELESVINAHIAAKKAASGAIVTKPAAKNSRATTGLNSAIQHKNANQKRSCDQGLADQG